MSKETEPHSPFSTEKVDPDELLRLESDTEARSSFNEQQPPPLPDSYQERLKLLDLEMTSDTRTQLNKVNK